MLPEALVAEMRSHLERIEILWNRDQRDGVAGVWLPEALPALGRMAACTADRAAR